MLKFHLDWFSTFWYTWSFICFIILAGNCIFRAEFLGFSPNCLGTGGGWGWGGNGHLLEAYSTKPICKPQSTMYYYYCRTHLERSAAARHVCTLAACFSQSSEDAPLQTLLSVTPSSFFLVVPVKRLVIIGHVNRSFYLLTYYYFYWAYFGFCLPGLFLITPD